MNVLKKINVQDLLFYAVAILFEVGVNLCFEKIFRAVPGQNFEKSETFLYLLLAAVGVIGTLEGMIFGLDIWSFFLLLVLPQGIYVTISYRRTFTTLIVDVFSIALLVFALYAFLLMLESKKYSVGGLLLSVFQAVRILFMCGTALIFAIIFSKYISGSGTLMTPSGSVIAENFAETKGFEQRYFFDTVLQLKDENWQKLTVQQKLNVLDRIRFIERKRLGLAAGSEIGLENRLEGSLGGYSLRKNKVALSLRHIEEDPAQEVVRTLLYELRRSYQNSLIEDYRSDPSESVDPETVVYYEKFQNYISGKNLTVEYYRACNEDAREYAEVCLFKYFYLF